MNNPRITGRLTQVMALSLLLATACAGPETRKSKRAESRGLGGVAASQKHVTVSLVNTTCPIMDEAVDPSGEVATFDGKSVGFCCDGCKPEWDSWTDLKKAEFVAKAEAK